MAGPNFGALVPANGMMSPHHFFAPSGGSALSDSFPFWLGAEGWQGRKWPGPGGPISFVQWLPREDVEVSSQHFVSYCVATS